MLLMLVKPPSAERRMRSLSCWQFRNCKTNKSCFLNQLQNWVLYIHSLNDYFTGSFFVRPYRLPAPLIERLASFTLKSANPNRPSASNTPTKFTLSKSVSFYYHLCVKISIRCCSKQMNNWSCAVLIHTIHIHLAILFFGKSSSTSALFFWFQNFFLTRFEFHRPGRD